LDSPFQKPTNYDCEGDLKRRWLLVNGFLVKKKKKKKKRKKERGKKDKLKPCESDAKHFGTSWVGGTLRGRI